MSLGPYELLVLLGALAPVVVFIAAGVITLALVRTGGMATGEESAVGWVRLGMTFGGLALLPVWALLTAFVLYAEYEMEVVMAWKAALVSLVLVVEAGAIIAALLLAVRGAMKLVDVLQTRSATRRYAEVVGDGGVLRADAWGPDVLETAEE